MQIFINKYLKKHTQVQIDYVKVKTILFMLEFGQIYFRKNMNASAGLQWQLSCFLKKSTLVRFN